MTCIMIQCPTTGQPTDTGMSVEQVMHGSHLQANYVLWCCPHCQQNHPWRLKDTFLARASTAKQELRPLAQ